MSVLHSILICILLGVLFSITVTQSVDNDQKISSPNEDSKRPSVGSTDASAKRPFIPIIPELGKSMKDPKIWKRGTRVVLFYTPWCEHSNAAIHHLHEMMIILHQNNITGVSFGKVDVSLNTDVGNAFVIHETPTLLFFQNGTRYDYTDSYSAKSLVQFLFALFRPPVVNVTTVEEVVEVQRNHSVVFLLVCEEQDDVDMDWMSVYHRVAKEFILRTVHLATNNTDILSDLGFPSVLKSFPGVVVLKDDNAYRYREKLSRYQMSTWVQREQFNALPTVNLSTFYPYTKLSLGRRIVLLFVNPEKSRSITEKKAVEAAHKVSESRKLFSGYQFVLTEDQQLVERMVRHEMTGPLPAVLVWEPNTGLHYPYTPSDDDEAAPFSVKSITNFIISVSGGKIKAHGELTYLNILQQLCDKVYAIFQAMLTHRPILSVVALISTPISIIFFCYNIFCLKTVRKEKRSSARAKALARAQSRKRREKEDERREEEEEKENGVRWRGERSNPTNDDNDSNDDDDSHDETEEEEEEENKNK